jgi:prevent-host-death family protein
VTKLSSREARIKFSEIINRARYARERTVITSSGKEVAAVVSMDDLKLLEAVLEEIEYRQDLTAAESALVDYEAHGGTPLDEVEKRLGLK